MHFVVCYPAMAATELAAVNAFRLRHEPKRARAIPPHVTVVFGDRDTPVDELLDRIREQAAATTAFSLTFDAVEPYRDPLRGESKVFLKVGGGRSQVKRLYRALNRHAGPSPYAFDPHMTIASADTEGALTAALADAASLPVPLEAKANSLSLVRFDGDDVIPLGEFAFRPPA